MAAAARPWEYVCFFVAFFVFSFWRAVLNAESLIDAAHRYRSSHCSQLPPPVCMAGCNAARRNVPFRMQDYMHPNRYSVVYTIPIYEYNMQCSIIYIYIYMQLNQRSNSWNWGAYF